MGYPKSLGEYSETDLIAEFIRRARVQSNGLCDYCDRPRTSNSCRFTEHHNIKEMSPIMQFFLKISKHGT